MAYDRGMVTQVRAPAVETPAAATEDPAVEAWRRIRSISTNAETVAAEHRLMRENDLTGSPLRALLFLPLEGSLAMRQLADRMGCDYSYVTPLIDSFEARGLATREPHPTDRRVKVIVLTEQGRRLAEQVQRAHATPPSVFSALTADEAATLRDLLRKLDPADG
jgi:DNA-binding MarR family transcriptional regulator